MLILNAIPQAAYIYFLIFCVYSTQFSLLNINNFRLNCSVVFVKSSGEMNKGELIPFTFLRNSGLRRYVESKLQYV